MEQSFAAEILFYLLRILSHSLLTHTTPTHSLNVFSLSLSATPEEVDGGGCNNTQGRPAQ